MGALYLQQQSAPGTPPASQGVLYFKSDGLLYWKDQNGTEYQASTSAGGGGLNALTGAAGTNTITATGNPTVTSLAAGQVYLLKPAANNTGSVTLQIDATAATAVKKASASGLVALVSGDLIASCQYLLGYDGTQYQLLTLSGSGITLATPQAATSGTSLDFTGIPPGTKRVTINFVGVSTNGTSNILVQIGPSGGPETSGYLGAGLTANNGASPSVTNYTAGWGIPFGSAANILHGALTLSLENSSTNTWTASGCFSVSNAAAAGFISGSKSLAGVLSQVRVTTVNGTDAFDAGEVNISYG